jgi:ubiquinone/menaquinone biosynthesis C-methylase UbiE
MSTIRCLGVDRSQWVVRVEYRDDMDQRRGQWQVDYDRVQHRVYQRGRTLDPRVVRQWMNAVAEHALPGTRRVADVGAGTGRFAAALAERLDASVIGVEPSIEMLKRAAEENPHPRVSYVVGPAETIPIASATIDLVFLSMVVHHLDDLSTAASEFARVHRTSR